MIIWRFGKWYAHVYGYSVICHIDTEGCDIIHGYYSYGYIDGMSYGYVGKNMYSENMENMMIFLGTYVNLIYYE